MLFRSLVRFFDIQETITNAQGGGLERGQGNHIWARDAGYKPDQIEIREMGWGYNTYQQKKWLLEGAVDSLRQASLSLGISDDEELDSIEGALNEWRDDPYGRCICTDSAVICKK